jgi:CRISPR-associated endoribonuclease Cas6
VRVKLTLRAKPNSGSLPLNCNHAITGLVYRILGQASAEFAAQLHDTGFTDEGRRFKLFTFSRLQFRRNRLANNRIVLDDPTVELQIGSPVGDLVEHFVTGLFQGLSFVLAEAETLTPPDFSTARSFRALSPITETVREEGTEHPRFLSPEDDWSEVIQRNLLRKYRALRGRYPENTNLR